MSPATTGPQNTSQGLVGPNLARCQNTEINRTKTEINKQKCRANVQRKDVDIFIIEICLTHKQLEMHGCIISTVATDVLMLAPGHRTPIADLVFIVLPKIHTTILHLLRTTQETKKFSLETHYLVVKGLTM